MVLNSKHLKEANTHISMSHSSNNSVVYSIANPVTNTVLLDLNLTLACSKLACV